MKNTSSIRFAIIALSCSLLLFTLTGLLGSIYVTHAAPVAGKSSSATQASSTTSPTSTDTPSPTPTDTPSPTPTDTPSPTPTDTPSPTPTDTPSPTPTRTRPTPTPVPTRQPGPTATTPIFPTATTAPNPTAAAATPNGNNGGGVINPTPTIPLSTGGQTPASQGGSTPVDNSATKATGGSNTFIFIFGGILTGIVLLAGAAILLVRKFLTPAPATKVNLPPSGARPWSRIRGVSMDGNTDLYGWENTADANQQAGINAAPFGAQPALSYSGFPDPAAASLADDTPFQSIGAMETQQVFQNVPSTDPGWMGGSAGQNEWSISPATPAPDPAFAQSFNGFAAAPNSQAGAEVNWAPGMGWEAGSDWGVWPTSSPEQTTRPSMPALPAVPNTPHASSITASLRAVRASRLQAMPQSAPQQGPDTR